jgi:hypothetical protein
MPILGRIIANAGTGFRGVAVCRGLDRISAGPSVGPGEAGSEGLADSLQGDDPRDDGHCGFLRYAEESAKRRERSWLIKCRLSLNDDVERNRRRFRKKWATFTLAA